jgi:hypothetical protein
MDIQQELIRHGEAIERLIEDEAVKATFEQLNAYYLKHWIAAEALGEREIIWAEMRALGRLKEAFETAVATGQAEAASAKAAEKPTRRD